MTRKQTKSAMWGRLIPLAGVLALGAAFAHGATTREPGNGTLAGNTLERKISSDLAGKDSAEEVDIIVQYNKVPTGRHHELVLSRGGRVNRDLGMFKGGAYTVPASALAELAADQDVVYISPDRPVHATSNGNPTTVLDYHLASINVSTEWSKGLTGAGIGVAVIDSGIAPVNDMTVSSYPVVYNQNFATNASNSKTATPVVDQYGHGTHVAGIIAGNGYESAGSGYFYTFKGVAPSVNIVNLRALDQNGSGTDSQVIAAIQEAILLKSVYNIRVMNLSLGRPVYESYTKDPLCQAVEQAWKAGIFVAVAAGNNGRDNTNNTNGYGTITAPGNDPYVMTVGAGRTMGSTSQAAVLPASYSSKGPTAVDHIVKPDILAPGNLITSLYNPSVTLNQLYPANEVPYSLYQTNGASTASPYYFTLSGTSMATPMVSGAAALLIQANSSLTPDQVKAMLMQGAFKNLQQNSTATDPTTGVTYHMQADIFTVGAGYLDLKGASQVTKLAPSTVGSALSPTASLDSAGKIVLVNGASVLSGGSGVAESVMWGSSVLWGTDTTGESVLWGSSVVWGTNTLSGYSVLWGSSSVYATSNAPAGEVSTVAIYGDH